MHMFHCIYSNTLPVLIHTFIYNLLSIITTSNNRQELLSADMHISKRVVYQQCICLHDCVNEQETMPCLSSMQ